MTLAHELAHLYCGHLGTPNDNWWPDRRGLSEAVREFEAESVAFLLCSRLGIENPSHEYLAEYIKGHTRTPPISPGLRVKVSRAHRADGAKATQVAEKEGGPRTRGTLRTSTPADSTN